MRRLTVESWALLGASIALWTMGAFAVVAITHGDRTASGTLAGSAVGGAFTTGLSIAFVRSDLRRRR